jgi:hypothetical protein
MLPIACDPVAHKFHHESWVYSLTASTALVTVLALASTGSVVATWLLILAALLLLVGITVMFVIGSRRRKNAAHS